MSFDIADLITDRTQSDVDRVKYLRGRVSAGTATEAEAAEYETDLKGAYNASDLNRVGAAVDYVAGRFRGQGYTVDVDPRTNWSESDTPTEGELATYLGNVKALRRRIAVKPTTPALPTDMTGLDYKGANTIEQTLADLDELLTNAQRAWYYSGEVYAGEV